MRNSFKIILLFTFSIISCNEKIELQQKNGFDSELINDEFDTQKNKSQNLANDTLKIITNEKTKVIVLQCSNGYGHNDFNRTIESEISKEESFTVVPFPNKKLLGVTFQGVYDKKYCDPIIEKLDVDYIIMTRFLGNIEEAVEITDENFIWGYEIKILNVKSMKQKISIRKDNLKEYQDIITDIERNGKNLIIDIQNLQ